MKVEGYYYWVVRMNAEDAAARGIKQHDLVKVYNDRGAVICAAVLDPAAAARRLPQLQVLGALRSDGRAGQVGRPRRLPQSAHAGAHADQDHAFARRRQLAGADRAVGRRIEHMSAAFAAMERDRDVKQTPKAAQLVPAK